jgi:hypothetical protein
VYGKGKEEHLLVIQELIHACISRVYACTYIYFISLSFIIKYFLLLLYEIMIQHCRPGYGTAMYHLRVPHTTLNSLYPPALSGVAAIANGIIFDSREEHVISRLLASTQPARNTHLHRRRRGYKHWERQPEQLVGDVTIGGPDHA